MTTRAAKDRFGCNHCGNDVTEDDNAETRLFVYPDEPLIVILCSACAYIEKQSPEFVALWDALQVKLPLGDKTIREACLAKDKGRSWKDLSDHAREDFGPQDLTQFESAVRTIRSAWGKRGF